MFDTMKVAKTIREARIARNMTQRRAKGIAAEVDVVGQLCAAPVLQIGLPEGYQLILHLLSRQLLLILTVSIAQTDEVHSNAVQIELRILRQIRDDLIGRSVLDAEILHFQIARRGNTVVDDHDHLILIPANISL